MCDIVVQHSKMTNIIVHILVSSLVLCVSAGRGTPMREDHVASNGADVASNGGGVAAVVKFATSRTVIIAVSCITVGMSALALIVMLVRYVRLWASASPK